MNDTTTEARKIQLDVIFSMSPIQRFHEGLLMIDNVHQIVENSIKAQNPEISEKELKIEIFKRYYKKDFTKQILENIIKQMK